MEEEIYVKLPITVDKLYYIKGTSLCGKWVTRYEIPAISYREATHKIRRERALNLLKYKDLRLATTQKYVLTNTELIKK